MSGTFLTERQQEILRFIKSFHAERGLTPTHREICEHFGYSSYGTVHKHLRLLREKGYLRRVQHQKRGLELVETGQSGQRVDRAAQPGDAPQSPFQHGHAPDEVREGALAAAPTLPQAELPQAELPQAERVQELPFLGRIAAGQPIEAISGEETFGVPPELVSGRGSHYILQVDGQSMIEEGIHDGDYVVVQSREAAEPGQMVVALIDGEATLKRFFPEGAQVRLQPSNATMEPIYVPAERLRLQGVVVGLMRRY